MAGVNELVLTTNKVAQLLGVSRQHAADLGDQGKISCWRVGTHRRFNREDVLAYRARVQRRLGPRLDRLNLSDRRSLAFGLLIAEKLVTSPGAVLPQARRNLDRLRTVHSDGSADSYLDKWDELLGGPVESILNVLTSIDEESVDLRHAAPVAGVLTEAERHSVIRSTRLAAA